MGNSATTEELNLSVLGLVETETNLHGTSYWLLASVLLTTCG